MPWNSVQKNYKQNCDKWQPCQSSTPTWNKSDLLPAMWTKLLQRLYKNWMAHTKAPPKHTPRHVVESLVQVHKTHVDWLGKIPRILKYSWEDIEFVQCGMNRTKLSCKPSWGGWGVWFWVWLWTGTQLVVSLLNNVNHHHSLSFQSNCPRFPRYVVEVCQPRQSHSI